MNRLLFGVLALAACAPTAERAPAAREDAMSDPGQPMTPPGGMQSAKAGGEDAGEGRAAPGPIPEPISVATNPASVPIGDSAAEALGRRTLSTAFVRVGPDNLLTVELRGGRTLVLRDVKMGPKQYCGTAVGGGGAADKHCGSYADVVAARPGGGDPQPPSDLAAPNPLPTRR